MQHPDTTQRRRGLLRATALLAVLLLILAVAALLPTGRIARSATTRDMSVASARLPSGAVFPEQTVPVAVEGEKPLAGALADALAAQPNMQPAAASETPLLIISVDEETSDVLWTPVFAEATVATTVMFSSNGSFAFRQSDPAIFEFTSEDDAPIVMFEAQITVSDRSTGWISRPAAYRWLADTIADEVSNAVQMHAFAAP